MRKAEGASICLLPDNHVKVGSNRTALLKSLVSSVNCQINLRTDQIHKLTVEGLLRASNLPNSECLTQEDYDESVLSACSLTFNINASLFYTDQAGACYKRVQVVPEQDSPINADIYRQSTDNGFEYGVLKTNMTPSKAASLVEELRDMEQSGAKSVQTPLKQLVIQDSSTLTANYPYLSDLYRSLGNRLSESASQSTACVTGSSFSEGALVKCEVCSLALLGELMYLDVLCPASCSVCYICMHDFGLVTRYCPKCNERRLSEDEMKLIEIYNAAVELVSDDGS
jgi:hypothetical protein